MSEKVEIEGKERAGKGMRKEAEKGRENGRKGKGEAGRKEKSVGKGKWKREKDTQERRTEEKLKMGREGKRWEWKVT